MSTRPRSPTTVISDHLRCRAAGRLDDDLADNYSPDVLLLSAEGVNSGHDGVRRLAGELQRYVPADGFSVDLRVEADDTVLLVWQGDGARRIDRGVDTFVVRDGKIVVQTIYYETRVSGPDLELNVKPGAAAQDQPAEGGRDVGPE